MGIRNGILLGLLPLVPLSLVAEWQQWGATAVFVTAGLALVPLSGLLSQATEKIALVVGPNAGGLLNATLGNATELIVAFLALKSGLIGVVKASITGSILSNLLLVMGLAMLLGGLRYPEQTFQPAAARANASAMNLAVVAILLPTAVDRTSSGIGEATLQQLSVAVALVLIAVYGLTLLFSLKTHAYLYEVSTTEYAPASEETAQPALLPWGSPLAAVAIAIGIESELLVSSLEAATAQLGLTPLFVGVIVLPVIGNAAEHAAAVTVALKDKMDLALSVAVGSSLQIALFVAPVLVIAGWWLGQPMDLDFNPFELVAVAVAVLVANSIASDGRSNWFEGSLLLATYTVIGLAFFFHPPD